jgi:MerR family transcriptional regulator/heat shock protein HspR
VPRDRPESNAGPYGISVAANLVGMGVQTLRLYESRGLLEPSRSDGGTRRYNDDDLERLRHIGQLLDQGLNLAGVAAVLVLEARNAVLQSENDRHRNTATTPSTRTAERGRTDRGRMAPS